MSRLIDEAELKEWVENWFYQNKYYHPYSKSNDIPCNELYDILERMPTIDAVEVVHGEWIEADDLDGAIKGRVVCSNCKNPFESIVMTNEMIILTNQKTNYCPNCGAKMDGEVKSDEMV